MQIQIRNNSRIVSSIHIGSMFGYTTQNAAVYSLYLFYLL